MSASLIGELLRAAEVLPTSLSPFQCPNNPTLLARCQAESGYTPTVFLARCNICAMDEEVLKKARIELARQGGKARAKSLSAEERKRIATKASKAAARARSLKAQQKANNRKS